MELKHVQRYGRRNFLWKQNVNVSLGREQELAQSERLRELVGNLQARGRWDGRRAIGNTG